MKKKIDEIIVQKENNFETIIKIKFECQNSHLPNIILIGNDRVEK